MIDTLEIKNFKSILALKLDCKRINVFIGEPNTGKSNILESLGMLSFPHHASGGSLGDFVRLENTGDLFYDQNLGDPMEINWGAYSFRLAFESGGFNGTYDIGEVRLSHIGGDHSRLTVTSGTRKEMSTYKFYKFRVMRPPVRFERPDSDYLLPPSGDNMVSLLLAHKKLRAAVNELLTPIGLRIGLRPQEKTIEIVKDYQDVIISYPYALISDTLQRVVFYMAAILTNKQSVLAFEEPEAHAFPFHTKYLAEMIALDENENQYFIATHNPYFLLPVLEKAPKADVAVFVTYYEDYQTKVRPLSPSEIEDSLEIDIFSNLGHFLEK